MNNKAPGEAVKLLTVRDLSILLTILVVIGGGMFLFFIKGLYLLPDHVCDGAVQRSLVIRTLPSARSADEWAGQGGSGQNFSYGCRVSTSGPSILSGMVNLRAATEADWKDSHGSAAGHRFISVSAEGVEALAEVDGDAGAASVYIPCTPVGVTEENASRPYALVTDASVSGKSKASGMALRQALTDFAYRLSEHAYKLAECKAPRDFPKELPRYEGSR